MKKISHARRTFCLSVGALSIAPHLTSWAADAYPSRPITLVCGWTAGGSADNVARLVATEMSKVLGQSVVVHNQPGAGGNIASDAVSRAAPDGYTIMLATVASHGFNAELYPQLNHRPIEDFAPIGLINTSPSTFLVPESSPYQSVMDFVAAAKAKPGVLNYGSGGVGSSQHLYGALFKKRTEIDIVHVPFKGIAPAMTDLMAGRVDMILSTGAVPFVSSGRLRALAVAAPNRLPALPNIPTFAEAGVKDFNTDSWYGLVAPAGTPRATLEILNAALSKVVQKPEVQQLFSEQGTFTAKPMTVDEFWAFVNAQIPVAIELVRTSGAKLE